MAGEQPPKIKLPGTKTDTSRLKTDTSRLKTDTAAKTPAAVPPPPAAAAPATPPVPGSESPTVEVPILTDPMTLRDTNTGRLRRVQADSQKPASAGVTQSLEMGKERKASTETVRLKVLREQKKEAGLGPAGTQTARLRPPTMASAETTVTMPQPPGEPVKVSPGDASKTIRLEVPTELTRPTATPPATTTSAAGVSTATSKKVSTATSRLQKATVATPPAGAKSVQATVKLKAPNAAETIKQPAPGELDADGPAPAAQTVKLAPDDTMSARKTLKLKAPLRPGKETAAGTAAAPTPAAVAGPAMEAGTDFLSLAASIVTFLVVGALTALLALQVLTFVL